MTKLKIIPAILALGIGVASMAPAHASSIDDKDSHELQASTNAAKTLSDSIKAANYGNAGRAFSVSMEKEDGKYVYKVSVLQGDTTVEYLIDPQSGAVSGTDEEDFLDKLFDWNDTRRLKDQLATSAFSLTQAISLAETQTDGRAIEAYVDEHAAELTFKVQTYKDGTVKQVNIDGKTGKVASITAPDSDDFEKEERRED
tara:strand:+ start:123 stop:722 length:600 start_codon:yes stop_codon:yes gene_type:complete